MGREGLYNRLRARRKISSSRADQLQRVLTDKDGVPVQNKLSASDVEALNDPEKREYVPFRILERRGDKVLVQWRGYPRADATWQDEDKIKL